MSMYFNLKLVLKPNYWVIMEMIVGCKVQKMKCWYTMATRCEKVSVSHFIHASL